MNSRSAVFGLTLLAFLGSLAACVATTPLPTFRAGPHTVLTQASAEEVALTLLAQGPAPRLWLLGEQHDAPEHQALQAALVSRLAAQGQLAAVVIEMADAGTHTRSLAPEASEAQAQAALNWGGTGWPWSAYGPVVMAAVKAGVPVLGANLPRSAMRSAMNDTGLDTLLPPAALDQQRRAIREGHCNLLPESQIAPMTRIQIARDQRMAQTAAEIAQNSNQGQTVLLLAGNNHVDHALGIPRFLPDSLERKVVMAISRNAADPPTAKRASAADPHADVIWQSPPRAPRDYCADMKRQMGR